MSELQKIGVRRWWSCLSLERQQEIILKRRMGYQRRFPVDPNALILRKNRTGCEFLEYIDSLPRTALGCALWPGETWGDGYPLVHVDGKWQRGNRAALAAFLQRPLGAGKLACHHCDTPLCINPEHLWEGTNQENKDDMVRKGRSALGLKNGQYTHPEMRTRGLRNGQHTRPDRTARGERNGNTTLTYAKVSEIIKIYSEGVSKPELALKFSISTQTIDQIISGSHWGCLK